MIKYADNKRKDLSFAIGDSVYVKLHPYKQTTIKNHKFHKLSKRYHGPYQTKDKLGPAA